MAKIIQLTQNGVNKYPRTIDEAVAVVAKSKKLSTVLAELGAEDERLVGLIAAANAAIETEKGRIDTLNGTGDGSVDKKIADAIDAFATQVTDNGTIDTVKELFDYVAAHGSEFNALLERVTTVEGKVTTLEGEMDTVEGKVSTLEGDNTTNKQNIAANTEAINGLNTKVGSSADAAAADGSLYARIAQLKADLSALSGDGGTVSEQINAAIEANNTSVVTPIADRVSAIESDYLKKADKDELAAAAAAAKTAADNAQTKADSAYELAESKIGYTELEGEYADFDEIALS